MPYFLYARSFSGRPLSLKFFEAINALTTAYESKGRSLSQHLSLHCDYCDVTFSVHVEIGFSLFDSYAVVNAFIAWKNFKLKGRPEKERAYRKYGIRQVRLDLIQRWCKRYSRHYKLTKPHKNKRLKWVIVPCNNKPAENTYFWVEMHANKAWIAVSWRASKHTKRTGLLRYVWRTDEITMLRLLARIEKCLSGLPHFREGLLSKDAWYAKWDVNLLISFKCVFEKSFDKIRIPR